jgi:hypothetical protein
MMLTAEAISLFSVTPDESRQINTGFGLFVVGCSIVTTNSASKESAVSLYRR